jgi:type I restriction-modification system DNA methylase subunit
MPAPKKILALIKKFDEHYDYYTSSTYSEAELRSEFIDPLFEELGWDVRNEQGSAGDYKEVVLEKSLDVEGSHKKPDYSFRTGRGPFDFFVEAKKSSINLESDPDSAFQLRRYGWSANLPLSILTNFKEFFVFDTRQKPINEDKAGVERKACYKYSEFNVKWDEIFDLFSKDAIRRGSLNKFIKSFKSGKGTMTVDDDFLETINHWRELLARNIALRNKISQTELNFAVTKIINRFIFLRICEDRGIERFGHLREHLKENGIYKKLLRQFLEADNFYDSGLFHFKGNKLDGEALDTLTPKLKIDDRVFREMIDSLYGQYEFSVMPVEILGQVYEQYLGKVIRLTESGHALVEEKPEVKRAHGVHYTPEYIVDHIVQNTVGKLCEGKTPDQVSNINVLDPACGSGSFMLGALKYLINWHEDYYLSDIKKYKRKFYIDKGGTRHLCREEKIKILLNNIYGVDIDPNAVEVAKLSLYIKILEGENQESLQNLHSPQHALPNLGENIKCGNSLIGTDYYDNSRSPSIEQLTHINPFDWNNEFLDIMEAGGFDAVIGNPPWGGDIDKELSYFHKKYPATTKEHTDSFKLFIEKAIILGCDKSLISMIIPNTLLRQNRLKDARELILTQSIISLIDLGEDVFKGVIAPSCIIVINKQAPNNNHKTICANLSQVTATEKGGKLDNIQPFSSSQKQSDFKSNVDFEFCQSFNPSRVSTIPIGNFDGLECKDAGINYQRVGVGMLEKGKSDLADRLLYEGERQKPQDQMYWKGTDIDRYWIAKNTNRFCRTNYKDFIRLNEVVRLNKEVYGIAPKILVRQTADHIIAAIDYNGVWFGRSILTLVPAKIDTSYKLEYFLGLLNSKYFEWLYNALVQEKHRVFAQVKLSKVSQLPIRLIDFNNHNDKIKHDNIVVQVRKMMNLVKQLKNANVEHEKILFKRQIEVTERLINNLVYDLYDLSPEEINVVEGNESFLTEAMAPNMRQKQLRQIRAKEIKALSPLVQPKSKTGTRVRRKSTN